MNTIIRRIKSNRHASNQIDNNVPSKSRRNIELMTFPFNNIKQFFLLFALFLTGITLPSGISIQIDDEAFAQSVDDVFEMKISNSVSADKRDPFNNVQNNLNTGNPLSGKSVSTSQLAAPSNSEIYGDFNGDGFDDLAIGVTGEDIDSLDNVGAVEIIYGDKNGLDARVGDQFITSISLAGDSEIAAEDDEFGSSLAAGDFNGDGRDD
jgi:hypothetical protein